MQTREGAAAPAAASPLNTFVALGGATAAAGTPDVAPSVCTVEQLMTRFEALASAEAMPQSSRQFDASKFVRNVTAHLENNSLLTPNEIPHQLRQPIIQVVRADEAQFRNTAFFLLTSRSAYGPGNPPRIVGVSDELTKEQMRRKKKWIQVPVSFLARDAAMVGELPDGSDDEVEEEDEEMANVVREGVRPTAPTETTLPEKLPDMGSRLDKSVTVAQAVCEEFEEFVILDGQVFSPLHLYDKKVRAASEAWKKNSGSQNALYAERCKMYWFIRSWRAGTDPATMTETSTQLRAAAMAPSQGERAAYASRNGNSKGFWEYAAQLAYNAHMSGYISVLPPAVKAGRLGARRLRVGQCPVW